MKKFLRKARRKTFQTLQTQPEPRQDTQHVLEAAVLVLSPM